MQGCMYDTHVHDVCAPMAQAAGVEMLRAILAPILLRRTKASLIDGQPIVALPPRHGTLWRYQLVGKPWLPSLGAECARGGDCRSQVLPEHSGSHTHDIQYMPLPSSFLANRVFVE